MQETGGNIYVLFLWRKKKDLFCDSYWSFYIKFMQKV